MMFKNKIIVLIILLTVIGASKQDIIKEKDNSIDKAILEHNSDATENKNPSKRGVFYQGHGLLPEAYSSYYGYQIPNFGGQILSKPLLSSSRPIAFSAPAGFGASTHYSNPPIFSNTISPLHTHPAPVHFGVPASPIAAFSPVAPTQYAIRPGGAVVQSYNVNYPQLHYHQKHYPSYAIAPAPVAAAIAPAAPILPFNNVHYHPTFAASPIGIPLHTSPVAAVPPPPVAQIAPQHFFVNRPPTIGIPPAIGFSQPSVPQISPQHFFVNRPPAIGIQFAPAPAPVVPHRPTLVGFASPSPTVGTFPSVIPIASGSAFASGQIPVATPVAPTIPTTVSSPWRPIIINNTPTTTAIPQPAGSAANRPPISLLPPYGVADQSNDDYSHYYNAQSQQNQQELTEQNYYADHPHKGYHY